MYHHILVPVDGSALSAANVRSALELAAKLAARVTFLHVTPDFAATQEGALFHAMDPKLFEREAIGDTNALLAKAITSARVAGVECNALACTSSRPAEAIVEATIAQGADLIVMASRGPRGIEGWLHSSQTQRVLRNAPVALLVTRVAATEPLRSHERALGVIDDEHRSIGVTMHCLRELAASPAPLAAPQREQIRLLIGYLRDFPQRLHHPKEEAYLHRFLRLRHRESEPLLAELEAQHVREAQLIEAVQAEISACEQDAAVPDARLRAAVGTLVDAVNTHLRLEEGSVFLLARSHLQEPDWAEIADAFEANGDPRFGELTTAEFKRLFVDIANLTMGRPAASKR